MSLNNITVKIDELVYQKIFCWVDEACPKEVSGFGMIEIKDGVHIVRDAFLLPQENSGSESEMEADGIAKAMYDRRESPYHFNFWWHSHANMDVFWSGTDYQGMRDYAAGGWVIATVFNKKREHRTAFYQSFDESTGRPDVFIDEIPTSRFVTIPDEMKKRWLKEYKENVKTKTYPIHTYEPPPRTPYWNQITGLINGNNKDDDRVKKPDSKKILKIFKRRSKETENAHIKRVKNAIQPYFRTDGYPKTYSDMLTGEEYAKSKYASFDGYYTSVAVQMLAAWKSMWGNEGSYKQ